MYSDCKSKVSPTIVSRSGPIFGMKYPGTTGSSKSVVPFACTQTAKSKSVPHNCFKVWPNLRHEIYRDDWIPQVSGPLWKILSNTDPEPCEVKGKRLRRHFHYNGRLRGRLLRSYVFFYIQEE
ncbi:hypothetical protein CEXT_507231 [Caerostris extrusa]|uniref:Uncharacterized protein n=1 Tax=Caerostris extrusa TaxID=172846 RepID=A0AAV4W770_CAEEX|nr:hypothetical protein CEXT_507231 [Caerostris extrusa]